MSYKVTLNTTASQTQDLLVKFYGEYVTECRTDVVALAIILYDWALTLDDEITYFWRYNRPFTIPNILFFASRYWGMAVVAFNTFAYLGGHVLRSSFCKTYFQYLYYNTGIVNVLLVQLIMSARLTSLYPPNDRQAAVGVIMVILAVMCSLSSALISNLGAETIFSSATQGTDLDKCVQVIGGALQISNWTIWMPIILFDFILSGLALSKSLSFLRRQEQCLQTSANPPAARRYRHRRHRLRFLSGDASLGTRLIKVMGRDSVFYFAVILILYLANAWTWGHNQVGIFQSITIALNTVLSSRLLINIRQEAHRVVDTAFVLVEGGRTPIVEEIEMTVCRSASVPTTATRSMLLCHIDEEDEDRESSSYRRSRDVESTLEAVDPSTSSAPVKHGLAV